MLLLRFEGWIGSNWIKGCEWEELLWKHAQQTQRPRAGEDTVSKELRGASKVGAARRCWRGEVGPAIGACGLGKGVGLSHKKPWETCTCMFTAALFITALSGNNLCLSTDERINKIWHIHAISNIIHPREGMTFWHMLPHVARYRRPCNVWFLYSNCVG